jgi:tryptophan synthase alpha chain
MSRLKKTFAALKAQNRKALVPFITAGDPQPQATVALMHALVRGGADVVELGVPFSDPMADGPTIQLACERALKHGTSLWDILDMVAEFRKTDGDTPVVLMGYLNPVETRGVEAFAKKAQASGVDGVLLVDLAVEEANDYLPTLRAHGLDCIFLLAPTSPDERIAAIARIRRHTELPLAVGFGIRDAASARAIGALADGVVVGSALVAEVERLQDRPGELPGVLQEKLGVLRAALDSLAASPAN